MFSAHELSSGGRVFAGLVLVCAILLIASRLVFFETDYLWGSLWLFVLVCLAYLCATLVPLVYRSSRTAYVLGGAAIGAAIMGIVGSRCDLTVIGALTGGLVGGVIAQRLLAGTVDTVHAGTVVFAGLAALFGPSSSATAFGGSLAVPGAMLGASIIWMSKPRRSSRAVSLGLAAAGLASILPALIGPRVEVGSSLAMAGCFFASSILALRRTSRTPAAADIVTCALQLPSSATSEADEGRSAVQASTTVNDDSAPRRSPGTIRRIMIAVVCCAFILGALKKDASSAVEGMFFTLFMLGAPAAGAILHRRWGGSGILGGLAAGVITGFFACFGLAAWLYVNPQIGALPEPAKQVAHATISGAIFGGIIGFLIQGILMAEGTSKLANETIPADQQPSLVPVDLQTARQRHFLLGVIVAATVYSIETDLAGTVGASGYSIILAAWILLLISSGFDLVRGSAWRSIPTWARGTPR